MKFRPALCYLAALLRPPLVWDVLALKGGCLVCYGLHCIYPPAAFLAAGLALAALGIWGAKTWRSDPE